MPASEMISPAAERWFGSLEVEQGGRRGERLVLLDWQRTFLAGAVFAGGVRRAALSVARGNGKTTLLGAVAAYYVAGFGPPKSEVVLVAGSFAQSMICYEHAVAFLRQALAGGGVKGWGVLGADVVKFRTAGNMAEAINQHTGVRLRVLASGAKLAHGRAPSLALADEPAAWPHGGNEAMVAALQTGLGKVPGSRFIAIGTRPASPAHWFSKWLGGHADYVADYSVRAPAPPVDDRELWSKANPSLAHFPDLQAALQDECRAVLANGNPHERQAFLAYRLNAGTPDVAEAELIGAAEWAACERDDADLPPRQGPSVLAFDLGQSRAMSASACYWPLTGRLEAWAAFPSEPGLVARAASDGVPGLYEEMHARGELGLLGGQVVHPRDVAADALQRYGSPARIVMDRYKSAELREALDLARFPAAEVVERGQGYRDGAEDVRRFVGACLAGEVQSPRSLLLRGALCEARVIASPAGDVKLAKSTEGGRRKRARDDAAAAAILAVAEGARCKAAGLIRPPRRSRVVFVD